jgi:hypothetical protein
MVRAVKKEEATDACLPSPQHYAAVPVFLDSQNHSFFSTERFKPLISLKNASTELLGDYRLGNYKEE